MGKIFIVYWSSKNTIEAVSSNTMEQAYVYIYCMYVCIYVYICLLCLCDMFMYLLNLTCLSFVTLYI